MDDNWSVRNIMNSWILSIVNRKNILERLPYEIQWNVSSKWDVPV